MSSIFHLEHRLEKSLHSFLAKSFEVSINKVSTLHKDAILGYVGGYVVRKILKNLSCDECDGALLQKVDKIVFKMNMDLKIYYQHNWLR